MKTFCSLAIVCVIAMAQTSFGLVISPNERPEFEKWSVVTDLISLIGADRSLEIASCVADSIDSFGILKGFDEKIINKALDKYAECIAPGNMGCFDVMSGFDFAVNKLAAHEYKFEFDTYTRVNDDINNKCTAKAIAYMKEGRTNH